MTAQDWAALQRDGAWEPAPFWHLCTPAQLPFVLGRFFAGQADVLVLALGHADSIRWETSEPGMDPFPHLYGPLRAADLTPVPP